MEPPLSEIEASLSTSRKRATLARLIKEARREFSENGVAGTRMEDIARAAGVTKQLVYHYFSSKEQLFATVLDESSRSILASLLALELDHLAPTAAMRMLLEHSIDHYRDDPTLGPLAQESFLFHEHNAGHRVRFGELAPILVRLSDRVLRRGAASGEFVPGVDARMFCTAAALLTAGGFTNRHLASALAGFDTAAAEGANAWREYAVNFILATLLVKDRPSMARPRLP